MPISRYRYSVDRVGDDATASRTATNFSASDVLDVGAPLAGWKAAYENTNTWLRVTLTGACQTIAIFGATVTYRVDILSSADAVKSTPSAAALDAIDVRDGQRKRLIVLSTPTLATDKVQIFIPAADNAAAGGDFQIDSIWVGGALTELARNPSKSQQIGLDRPGISAPTYAGAQREQVATGPPARRISWDIQLGVLDTEKQEREKWEKIIRWPETLVYLWDERGTDTVYLRRLIQGNIRGLGPSLTSLVWRDVSGWPADWPEGS